MTLTFIKKIIFNLYHLFTVKNSIVGLSIVALIVGITVFPRLSSAEGTAVFLSDNIMTAGNRTTRVVDWEDPVNAEPGNLIEFRILAQNTAPGTVATNVKVTANLQSTRASTITATGTISADNAASTTDTATVNITNGELQRFDYLPGHVRVFSPSCPNGCDVGDTVLTSGVNVGNLALGERAQVLFKAFVTNFTPQVTPTPTPTGVPPTVTPTATPTPTGVVPTVTPTPIPQGQVQAPVVSCPEGFIETVSGNTIICLQQVQQQNQQQQAISNSSANASTGPISINVAAAAGVTPTATPTVAPTTTPAPTPTAAQVTQLPKTGLPLLAWALGGFLPAGALMRKLGLKNSGTDNASPHYLVQEREFFKES